MGSDENETMTQLPNMVGSVAFFPERYGNWLVPMILAELGGQKLPDAVLIKHLVVNKTNVCKYYDFKCADSDPYVTFEYRYPEAAFQKLLDDIRADPKYAGSLDVLPKP
jgi:ribose transport system substrate-binding protein